MRKWRCHLRGTRQFVSQCFDGVGESGTIDFIGPFVRVAFRVVKFFLAVRVSNLSSILVADGDVALWRLPTQTCHRRTLPWGIRILEQRQK